ncbi:MAG: DNA translocase FtsK [Planctomycetota bacterium]|nr:DNA translocase FtsK [Planctomycetota bacterium]
MFNEAVEIILSSQRGSVSLLQRRLQVGYSRASRIVARRRNRHWRSEF